MSPQHLRQVPRTVHLPDSLVKCEIRLLYVWHPDQEQPHLLCGLSRLSRGEMIGVYFNKNKDWGAALHRFFKSGSWRGKLMKYVLATLLLLGCTSRKAIQLPAKGEARALTYYSEGQVKQEPLVNHQGLLPEHVLIDSLTGTKFIIDSSRVTIRAIDKAGKQVWKTDPHSDNHLGPYRMQRPLLVYAHLCKWKGQEVICIVYENSQFGYLEKSDGKFVFLGQD